MNGKPTYILGLSCHYHDSAACLIKDGVVVSAIQEERLTRKKFDPRFPENAITAVLKQEKITLEDVDYVGFYEKPLLKFERILDTFMEIAPRGNVFFVQTMGLWLKEKLWMGEEIKRRTKAKRLFFIDHHLSHAASTFYASPFEESAILTIDGVGEWATASYGYGKGNEITMLKEMRFPHSLGLLYSAFTVYLGFKINSGEYKVMGLAPLGKPTHYKKIVEELVKINEDGSIKLNLKYFSFLYGETTYNKKFERLFGLQTRKAEAPLTQEHFNIARSIQLVSEEIMLKMAKKAKEETKSENLCLSGGVALNCVANGRILREAGFKEIYIPPVPGDNGGAMGVASYIYYSILKNKREKALFPSPYLGQDFNPQEIMAELKGYSPVYMDVPNENVLSETARLIEEGNVIGFFQGRSEYGARALGNRSILADARNPKMKDILNLKIKFRETFRPFAPAVLEDKMHEYFDFPCPSPYMILVGQVREGKKEILPSITHVDGSARVQSVSRVQNPRFYDLISEFCKRTGVPVIINTSFNVRGEPIVNRPREAFECFMRTNMDYLVIEDFMFSKKDQKQWTETKEWTNNLNPD